MKTISCSMFWQYIGQSDQKFCKTWSREISLEKYLMKIKRYVFLMYALISRIFAKKCFWSWPTCNFSHSIFLQITQNPIVNLTQPCSESEDLPQIHNFNPHYYCPPSGEVVSSECETSSPSSSLVDPQKRPIAAALRPLPTTSSSPSSLKRLPHQVKSLGQTEFKAMALNSDLTQVQEKLAALDHFGGINVSVAKWLNDSNKKIYLKKSNCVWRIFECDWSVKC